ncbi:mannan-binding lectin serine protease 2 isoform X1 [Hydra vulgaris]|uniref:mannan-binding lectin serine protease 2 isoform X1 n=3 Tax=Hydra vulgaris TaxID=6087 RepID=UPI001F5EBF68|nr:mannan-binding lectin serine protease 2-like isoform X1 [Hydra vulgaris]XP_047125311.1 mannan-binding lectin serine protease 2-like isoform X1 [Hydra vulgaris]
MVSLLLKCYGKEFLLIQMIDYKSNLKKPFKAMHYSTSTLFFTILQVVKNVEIKDNSKCGGNLQKLVGTFHTPNYPKMYPNKLNCVWNITVPNGYRLQLNFTEFELEWTDHCSYDYVEVKATNGTIGKYCGKRTEKPLAYVTAPSKEPIYSVDNSLEVLLYTDFSNEIEVFGFIAHFAALDINECLLNNGDCSQHCHNYIGGYYCSCRVGYFLHDNNHDCIVSCQNVIQNKMEGIITSPEYPYPYPPFARCEYHITAEKGYFINLRFLDFKIEDHHESLCPYDYLLIEDEKEKKGPYCGKTKPDNFISFSNWLIVEFRSDKSLALTGFKAEFKLQAIKCPTLTPVANGFMSGHSNFSLKETVTFSCREGYIYTGSETRTCLPDGSWSGYLGNCTRITCNDPEIIPDEGYITDPSGITPYYYGHKLNVHCDTFHDLFGSKTITCVGNNTWAGLGSYCVKTCGKSVQRNFELETCKGGGS